MNVVFLRGSLSSPPVRRELPSGDSLVAYEVTVRPPAGPAESVPVAWFGAPASAEGFTTGAEVLVTGRVRRRFFRAGGTTASRTEVLAETVVLASQKRRASRAVQRAVDRVEEASGAGR